MDSSGSSWRYLMFFYDVETTGIRINDDHIIEIGAAVFGDTPIPNSTFSQLVHTDVRIPRIGMQGALGALVNAVVMIVILNLQYLT